MIAAKYGIILSDEALLATEIDRMRRVLGSSVRMLGDNVKSYLARIRKGIKGMLESDS